MDFLWCVSELSDSSCQDFLSLIELFQFTVDIHKIQKDARSFLHSELLAEVGLVLILAIIDGAGWVLHSRQLENVLKRLFSLLPVFLLDFNFRFHEHEDGVVTDGKVLCESLLQVVVSRTHIASVTVDDCGEDVRLHDGRVLVQAVRDLSQGPWRVIKEPSGLRKEDLGLRER